MLFLPLLLHCMTTNTLPLPLYTYTAVAVLLLHYLLLCSKCWAHLHMRDEFSPSAPLFRNKGETSLGNQCQILTEYVNVCRAIHGCFPSGMDKHPSPPNPTNSALASLLVQNLSFHAAKHSSKYGFEPVTWSKVFQLRTLDSFAVEKNVIFSCLPISEKWGFFTHLFYFINFARTKINNTNNCTNSNWSD